MKTKTYVFCKKAGEQALRNAEKEIEGQLYNCMYCIIFCAFMLEAYINHLGACKDPGWDEWDRDQHPTLESKFEKLNLNQVLTESEKHKVSQLMKVRNSIAHSRTEIVSKKSRNPPNNTMQMIINLQSHLEQECSLKKIQGAFEFSIGLIEKINKSLHGEQKGDLELWSPKEGSFQLSP